MPLSKKESIARYAELVLAESAKPEPNLNMIHAYGVFLAKLVQLDNKPRTCECGMWEVAEYGPVCPSCPSKNQANL